MSIPIELKEIEKKAWTSYFHDGLWDIYGGLIFLGLGLSMVTDQMWWLSLMLPGFLALLARKRITTPRMGYVRFSPARQSRTRKSRVIAIFILSVILLIGMGMFLFASTDRMSEGLHSWLQDYFLIAFGAMNTAVIGIAAYVVGITRFYVYAALCLIAFSVGQWFDTSAGVPVSIAGGIVLLSGLAILLRFLRKYPLPEELPDGDR